jgi:hypothetical protein
MCIRASPVIAARKQFACQNLDEICIMMASEKGILWSYKLGGGWWSFQMHVKRKMTASGRPMIMIGLVMAFNIVTHFQVRR